MTDSKNFEGVLYAFSDRITTVLNRISPTVKANTSEIRLRVNMPLAITVSGETVFIRENGATQFFLSNDLFKTNESDLQESFRRLCNNSVFAHENELKKGYIVMKNGSRAGICGSITSSGGFHNVSSINIRIAHEVLGCANQLIYGYKHKGLLIAGPPGSGKTTILRDFIRQLSNGACNRLMRIAVIDSRRELSGSLMGHCCNDLGCNTDVLITEQKCDGIEIALRTMFPHIIAFDEIATLKELKQVSQSLYAGVSIITTAHVGSVKELKQRQITSELLSCGAIGQVAVLPQIHGGKIKILDTKELFCEAVV